jgi:hypothetical protein
VCRESKLAAIAARVNREAAKSMMRQRGARDSREDRYFAGEPCRVLRRARVARAITVVTRCDSTIYRRIVAW